MIIIRPIQSEDFQALREIAVESGHGFTSLPVNDELLERKIKGSIASFKTEVTSPGCEGYLFVMEDTESGEIMGCSGIEAAVGLDDAFYHYHLGKVVHSSRELNIYNTVDTLTLCNDYTGATEICTLFLRKSFRRGNLGKMLSKFRFLFIAEHRERFSDTVIAEMRGVSDQSGSSPFWVWLEENFFSMDFPTADYLTGIGNKVFIAELMPKYPIYVNLLSKEAQSVIGKVHDQTRPALKLLQNEGFACQGYVDIFDAGPTVEARVNQIKTVRKSKNARVVIEPINSAAELVICNDSVTNFRATLTKNAFYHESDQTLKITEEVARHLSVQNGDVVRFVSII